MLHGKEMTIKWCFKFNSTGFSIWEVIFFVFCCCFYLFVWTNYLVNCLFIHAVHSSDYFYSFHGFVFCAVSELISRHLKSDSSTNRENKENVVWWNVRINIYRDFRQTKSTQSIGWFFVCGVNRWCDAHKCFFLFQ